MGFLRLWKCVEKCEENEVHSRQLKVDYREVGRANSQHLNAELREWSRCARRGLAIGVSALEYMSRMSKIDINEFRG